MKTYVWLLWVLAFILLLCGCHTRQVAINKLDSISHTTGTTTDNSKIVIHRVVFEDTKIAGHTIIAAPHRYLVPFMFGDSTMAISIAYDSSGNVLASATEKARIIKAKVEETITKQNDIITKTQNETELIKKDKVTAAKGIPVTYMAVGILAILLAAALVWIKIK